MHTPNPSYGGGSGGGLRASRPALGNEGGGAWRRRRQVLHRSNNGNCGAACLMNGR